MKDDRYEELENRVKELEDTFSGVLKLLMEFRKQIKSLETQVASNKQADLRSKLNSVQENNLRRTLGNTISSIADWQDGKK